MKFFSIQIFQGNVNTYMAELREVSPPIIARKIRLHPYSNQTKYVCLRVELYGCDWTGGWGFVDLNEYANFKKMWRDFISGGTFNPS